MFHLRNLTLKAIINNIIMFTLKKHIYFNYFSGKIILKIMDLLLTNPE